MAHWVLLCPRCRRDFNYCEVQPDSRDLFIGIEAKPTFPGGGLSIACQHCNETSVFERYELRYSAI